MGPVDVVQAVRDMGDILERSLGPSVFVTTRFPPSLPLVRTDKAQLESAVLNLAVNARDAMPAGGPIDISAVHKTVRDGDAIIKPGNYVVLSVADKGEGMDETTLARAAEPFFTTKGVGKGTGLGLSMVHGLAEQSGGKFVLSSNKGRGTTAELWLPLTDEAAAAADIVTTPAPAEEKFAAKRILVVDDDFLVLLNTVTMTEDLGHQVFEATSGKEALAILKNQEIDILITDYAMPKMNGGELASAVATSWGHTKIIVATGYAEMPTEHKGRFELLGKPFGSQDLKTAIERAVAN